MLSRVLKDFISKIWPPKYYAVKSFSYFLPAPPKRSSGYQEKELDLLVSHLCRQGYELIEMSSQALSLEGQAGVWVFCKMGALTKEAASNNIDVDYQSIAGNGAQSDIPMDPDIVHDN